METLLYRQKPLKNRAIDYFLIINFILYFFFHFFLAENDVIHAFGVLRINSFGIDTKMGGRGRGLFPLLALMSHSCQSNLQHEQSKSMSAMV